MRALAIDTSTHRAEVVLSDGGTTVARAHSDDPTRHAESSLGLIDRVFGTAGWRKTDLDLVVPCLGPGSFTGVRVGLATAKGIALALDLPIVGVSGLEAMAEALGSENSAARREAGSIVALIDARKGELFWAAYGPGLEKLRGPGHVPLDRLGEVLEGLPLPRVVVGEVPLGPGLAADVQIHRSPTTDLPDAAAIARLGIAAFQKRGSDDIGALEPIYVRPPDITLPRVK